MSSHNLAHIKIDDLEVIGYSVAGEETVIAIPQLDVCFDIGKAPDQVISINHVLLTHGHMDHAAGFAYYLSQRNFCGISAGTIIAPKNLLKPIREIINSWSRLDGNKIPAKIVGVKPGDEYQIKPNLFARVFPTKHSNGSVGYSIIEKRKKLKKEYTIVLVPHSIQQAARTADWCSFFLQGELIEHSTGERLFTNPEDERTRDYVEGRFG